MARIIASGADNEHRRLLIEYRRRLAMAKTKAERAEVERWLKRRQKEIRSALF